MLLLMLFHWIFVCVCVCVCVCRWDMQRARSLWNYEELKKKYELKSGEKPEKKKERMTSFLPKLGEGIDFFFLFFFLIGIFY